MLLSTASKSSLLSLKLHSVIKILCSAITLHQFIYLAILKLLYCQMYYFHHCIHHTFDKMITIYTCTFKISVTSYTCVQIVYCTCTKLLPIMLALCLLPIMLKIGSSLFLKLNWQLST